MLVVTTPTIAGSRIVQHLGILSGERSSARTSSRTSSPAFATSSEAGLRRRDAHGERQRHSRRSSARRVNSAPIQFVV